MRDEVATSSAGLRSRETSAQSSRSTAASRVERPVRDAPAFSTKTRSTQPPRSGLNSRSTTSAPCARTTGSTDAQERARSMPWRVKGVVDMREWWELGQKNAGPGGVPRSTTTNRAADLTSRRAVIKPKRAPCGPLASGGLPPAKAAPTRAPDRSRARTALAWPAFTERKSRSSVRCQGLPSTSDPTPDLKQRRLQPRTHDADAATGRRGDCPHADAWRPSSRGARGPRWRAPRAPLGRAGGARAGLRSRAGGFFLRSPGARGRRPGAAGAALPARG